MRAQARVIDREIIGAVMVALLSAQLFAQHPAQAPAIANATSGTSSAKPMAISPPVSPPGMVLAAQTTARIEDLPPPKIGDSTGVNISSVDGSGQTPPLQSVVLGQNIGLRMIYPTTSDLPNGSTFTSYAWTVGAKSVGSFAHNSTASEVKDTALNQQNISFYWISQGNPVPVTLKYCAQIPSVGVRCSLTARALFKVAGPQSLQVYTCGGDVGQILVNAGCPVSSPLGTLRIGTGESRHFELALGDTYTDAGMVISAYDDPTTSPPGDFYFDQLIRSYTWQYVYANGRSCAGGKGTGLDDDFDPFQDVDTAKNGAEFVNDNPGANLFPDDKSVQWSFQATMYVMWMPRGSFDKIPVPLGSVTWGVSDAEADHNIDDRTWSLKEPDNKPPTGYAAQFVAGTDFPNWPPVTKQFGNCSH